ncbi:hypothetical protein STFE110948_05355 [Streptobacillus felis]|uniref:Uncharacterized protein n=1 Tax=Streptobacillus felis TaxID=1384509 RepID=A0A7Z0PFJ7_9FUSO|nr:hypothetical protein [Streptobacillus felis]NYV28286.1 hypothetical protein [Streptobacillus felis]
MKNKGISLLYVLIFSSISLLVVSSIFIYRFERIKTMEFFMHEKYSAKMLENDLRRGRIKIIDYVDRSDVV